MIRCYHCPSWRFDKHKMFQNTCACVGLEDEIVNAVYNLLNLRKIKVFLQLDLDTRECAYQYQFTFLGGWLEQFFLLRGKKGRVSFFGNWQYWNFDIIIFINHLNPSVLTLGLAFSEKCDTLWACRSAIIGENNWRRAGVFYRWSVDQRWSLRGCQVVSS